MNDLLETMQLTHKAVMTMLAAGVRCAEQIGQPQCIVIVDASGVTLGELRMTGSKFLSLRTARAKAVTAASHGVPSGSIPETVRLAVAAASDGLGTGLPGGLPICLAGTLLGGIGVGSGLPEQDLEVARAALAAIGANRFEED